MKKTIISLNGAWYFSAFTPGDGEKAGVFKPGFSPAGWRKGSVPGSVHGDLFSLGELPDPVVEQNTRQYRFIDEKEWWYTKDFTLDREVAARDLFLKFEGLDTISTIYLNGKKLGKTANMLIPHEFKITGLVSRGKNRLAVRFDPVIREAERKDKKKIIESTWKSIPEKNLERIMRDREKTMQSRLPLEYSYHIRKANFAYGGDMSQRLLTVGIWRPVSIVGYEGVRINNVRVRTRLSEENRKARVSLAVEINKFLSRSACFDLDVRVTAGNKAVFNKTFKLSLDKAKQTRQISFDVASPLLWWPNGTGEPNLYELNLEIKNGEKAVLDARSEKFGIREIALIQEKDKKEGGTTFTFAVNGIKIFAKGANWLPADNLMHPVPKIRYRKLLGLAKEANFNMLRINGFGLYEDREFYNACDEMGIMIWQDFIFSDCMYPDDDPKFLAECRKEAEVTVRNLRNHPSIVLWCGNNEVDEIYYAGAHERPTWKLWGEKIFHDVLPGVCQRLDPTRPYWPSSAWSAPGKFPLWEKMGDYHFYPVSGGVWRPTKHPYGKRIFLPLSLENTSYRLYAREKAKFYSEFGLASLPSVRSLRKIMKADKLWPMENNPAWDYHIAASWPKDNFLKIIGLLNSEFGTSRNLEDFVLYSQLSQATTLKFAVEHFRTRKFSCSGALFWQYNDCWPTLTFSVVDYYLDKKIAYYWVKKAFVPVLLTFIETGKNLEIWAVNDLSSEVKGTLLLSRMSFQGNSSLLEEKEIAVPAGASLKVGEIGTDTLKAAKDSEFLWAKLEINGRIRAENRFFFLMERDLLFPACNLRHRIERIKNGCLISVSTDVYARLVKIDTGDTECELSDNFFDLAPGEQKTIRVTRPLLQKGKGGADFFKIQALNS